MLKGRFAHHLTDEDEKSPSPIVKALKLAIVAVRFVFADHDWIWPDSRESDEDSDSEDSIKKSEEPDEGPAGAVSDANNSVVRHSAKCAILTKKGWSAI